MPNDTPTAAEIIAARQNVAAAQSEAPAVGESSGQDPAVTSAASGTQTTTDAAPVSATNGSTSQPVSGSTAKNPTSSAPSSVADPSGELQAAASSVIGSTVTDNSVNPDDQAAATQAADAAAADPVKLKGHQLIEQNQHLIEPVMHRNKLMQLMHDVVTQAERVENWTKEELIELSVILRDKL